MQELARSLGVVSVAYGSGFRPSEAARAARAQHFAHLDVGFERPEQLTGLTEDALGIPIGDFVGPVPVTGGTVTSPRRCSWDDAVARLSAVPGIRVEPTPGSVLSSVGAIRAMCADVPGLRLTLDTGHCAVMGFDPLEVADLAGHVQLRQAAPGRPQLHPDAGGDVDFAALLAGLHRLGYPGRLSIEYFDLPEFGLPLADPVGHCLALRDHIVALPPG